jgi:hypothetical protein
LLKYRFRDEARVRPEVGSHCIFISMAH